jgi:hypothetical protein
MPGVKLFLVFIACRNPNMAQSVLLIAGSSRQFDATGVHAYSSGEGRANPG